MIYDQYAWSRSTKAWIGPNGSVEKSHVKSGWFRWSAVDPFSRQRSGVQPTWEDAVQACENQNLVPLDPE